MKILPISKAQAAAHELSGIVYAANGDPDTQREICSDPEVLKAAMFDFMTKYAENGIMFNADHDDEELLDLKIVESVILDEPTTRNGKQIPENSWLMTLKVPDELYPQLEKARGFSMQGKAESVKSNGYRDLKNIELSRIAICLNADPANRFEFVVKKSADEENKDLEEILKSAGDLLGEDFKLEEIDKEKFLACIETLKLYQGSYPEDIQEAISALLGFAAKTFGDEEEEADDVNKSQVLDEDDPWANLPFAVPAHLIKKSDEIEPEPEPDPDDEFNHDPTQIRLSRIEKKLDAATVNDDEIDNYPSLDPIIPGSRIPLKKSQPTPKVDPDIKQKAISKQIRDAEGNLDIKKVDDEDLYPSIPDGLFERP